ncbi:suppressor of fused domain protein [Pseudomonas aeruginosa]|uniref:suppressor of fused domain protein n=1 Tax=Pseudomonas aeruginosa TaxID=287 RepID=UPI000EB1625F|nr:suppressor of fused domain protein [Pseudomonas aeruginosa]MCV6433190.1 suppressor of fused domain protein [Pseudomonas aeruginosa]MCV6440820.1 suppressor of fused domain protein [Pseudomonas aeruginosa]HBP1105774.1 suppressor of fused domain protein [Pseudomonas aeruginosa]HCE7043630.1 suppressor of fused domain protein [Pseudomonas aeruginosa]HCE7539285.1 suppressor of fused domain protein [Pseudomonas aeruginosa]
MNVQQYRHQFHSDDAVGWRAIDAHLTQAYGAQVPRHYAPGPSQRRRMGGDNPLDGCSIYDHAPDGTLHRHVVSYGMSALYYDEDSAGGTHSGWGFEFTMRVLPCAGDPDAQGHAREPMWVLGLMQNLARYVFDSGQWFEAHHFVTAKGPLRLSTDTALTAVAFAPDPQLGTLATPHGEVAFLQMVGLTEVEYQWLLQEPTTQRTEVLLARMRQDDPWLCTDLARRTSYV